MKNCFALFTTFVVVVTAICCGCNIMTQTGNASLAKSRQAKGPHFSTADSPRQNKALIYFYRLPPKGWSTAIHHYFFQINGKKEKVVPECGYSPYEAEPGHVTIL